MNQNHCQRQQFNFQLGTYRDFSKLIKTHKKPERRSFLDANSRP